MLVYQRVTWRIISHLIVKFHHKVTRINDPTPFVFSYLMWAGRGVFSRKMAPYPCTTAAIGCHWILTHWPMIIIVWPIIWSTSKRLGRVRVQTNSIRTRSHTGWWIVFGCLKPPQFHLIFPNRTGLSHSFSKYLKILQPCSGSSSFQPFPWQFVLFFLVTSL